MGSEVAPEYVLDQGLYYPAAANSYGYYTTVGTELPIEWDDQHRFSGLDTQAFQYPALQTESMSFIQGPANYEYVQSPYNPYNPFIPGAVMGIQGPFIGTSQYLNEPSFQQAVSSPAYFPVLVQSSSDVTPYSSTDPFFVNTAAGKYVPPLSSVSVTPSPLKETLQNPTFEPFRPSNQMPQTVRPLNGSSVNSASSRLGTVGGGISPYTTQATDHSLHMNVQPIRAPVKVAIPANNSFSNPEPNADGWSTGERIRPRAQLNGMPYRNLPDQNRGPRINRSLGQLTSSIASRSNPTKDTVGNSDGKSVHADQYNKDNFPLDYAHAKFFVIKSYSEDDVHKSIKYNVWSSTSSGNRRLDAAYSEALSEKQRKCPVFLFFSVNASGQFCGVAEMIGHVDFQKDMDFWLQDKWTGSFPVKWHIVKDVPNTSFRHIILVNNEHRPVTSSRDTQEVPYLPGMSMLTIFKNSPITTSILDDYMYYEERQRIMQDQKSRYISRRTHQTLNTVYIPTSVKLDNLSNQKRITDTIARAAVSDRKELNIKEPSCDESSGEADNHSEEESQNLKFVKPPSSDGKQNTTWVRCLAPGKTVSLQQNENPKHNTEIKIAEIDTTEILTVGSMQIKVNNANRSFTGSLTLGMNELKLK